MQIFPSGRFARTSMAATLVAAFTIAAPAAAGPSSTACGSRALTTVQQLTSCVGADTARVHLQALQDIADANGGTRASGTPGFDASADYVAGLLEDAGYSVERQVFDYPFFALTSDSLTIDGATPEYATMTYSGSGGVAGGNVVPVDLQLGPGNGSTSGCEAGDFAGLNFGGPNDIALIQRGTCSFFDKARNAQNAGAEGVIIFNQGNTPDREGVVFGTLGAAAAGVVTIPVIGMDYATGVALSSPGEVVSMSVDGISEIRTTENVVADMAGRNADNVVMAGAHLDSRVEGPGIQDNGSGSAAILAVALQLASSGKYVPQNTLRFAWWGAEESGLVGSTAYVFDPGFGLTDEEYEALALYLNFDMIASPNGVFGVYDADESTFAAPVVVPPGSIAIEDVFEAFYTDRGEPYDDSAFSGRSDYQAFINVGIPAGGLFTGAEVIKTPAQAAIWGGTAGDQFDPCYHLACDTIDNVSMAAMEVNIDAIATSVFLFAASTKSVNGVAGAKVPGGAPTAMAGPQGTFVGGGGHDGHHSTE